MDSLYKDDINNVLLNVSTARNSTQCLHSFLKFDTDVQVTSSGSFSLRSILSVLPQVV